MKNVRKPKTTLSVDKIDIVLIGYYGKQNFGDDVLMLASYEIARKLAPDARIGLLGTKEQYVTKLINGDVGSVPYGSRRTYQLIVHGGGGTFFDFAEHDLSSQAINRAALALGPKVFVMLDTLVRRLTRKQRMSSRARIGLGLGVGTFSPGSPALLSSLPTLLDFKALWVRDPGSIDNLKAIVKSAPTIQGSDLAFLHKAWCPREFALAARPPRNGRTRPLIGLVLRDWPAQDGGQLARNLRNSVEALSRNYRLRLVSLNPNSDRETIKTFPDMEHLLWQPESINMSEFLKGLAEHDALISARAHGAICGACLGLPTVILGIEPKLSAVHSMLRNSSQFVAEPFSKEALCTGVERALMVDDASIASDVERNSDASEEALNKIIKQLTSENIITISDHSRIRFM